MTATGAPPGWYPDPWQPAHQRWWDGREWTGYAAAPGPGSDLHLDEEDQRGARAGVAILVAVPLLVGSSAAAVWFVRVFVDRWHEGYFSHPESHPFGTFALGPQLLAQAGSLARLAAGVLFLLWFHRAATNAKALGLAPRRDAGLATGSFIIPVVSLWWPYQSTCDLLPPGHPGRAHVLRWWLLWIVGGIVANVVVLSGAVVSPGLGAALLVVPAAQLVAAALAARQVIAEVGDAHRALAGADNP